MPISKRSIAFAALMGWLAQAPVLAHAPVFGTLLPVHHATTSPNIRLLSNTPVSGSARAFQASMKLIVGGTIKNTVLNAPLNNISGQLTGYDYFHYSSGFAAPYSADFPNVLAFGSNPLNNGYFNTAGINVPFGNVFSTGLQPVSSINLFHSAVSGAQRTLQGYFNAGATAGYNGGISLLQHPTGGLLFGTVTFQSSPGSNTYYSAPSFYAFGNNPYASAAVAQNIYNNPITLSQPLPSYIQFGKIIRPITNGYLYGTYYGAAIRNPPFGAGVPNPYQGFGYNIYGFGTNPFNTGMFVDPARAMTFSPYTFFK